MYKTICEKNKDLLYSITEVSWKNNFERNRSADIPNTRQIF